MTWEETIKFIRTKPEYNKIVESCYYDADLVKNQQFFQNSKEFKETIRLLKKYSKKKTKYKIIDIGAGNGIAAVSFALLGWDVVALEPDKSETIGSGAIVKLKEHYHLDNLEVISTWGEKIPLKDGDFDIVYCRQVLHHANDLEKLVAECARLLKKGGIIFTNRDHVVNDEKQKEEFFQIHPLHKYYGGENAFKLEEYLEAFKKADLLTLVSFGPIDNIIQLDKYHDDDMVKNYLFDYLNQRINKRLTSKYSYKVSWIFFKLLLKINLTKNLLHNYVNKKTDYQSKWAGRTFAFILKK